MDAKIDKKQVMSLYHSGMNMRQVGEALGVSNSAICKFMIKHNINDSVKGLTNSNLFFYLDKLKINFEKIKIDYPKNVDSYIWNCICIYLFHFLLYIGRLRLMLRRQFFVLVIY